MTISSEQYAAYGGAMCPSCGSHNISSTDQIDHDCDCGTQNIECLDCGAQWTDVWHLRGYTDLRAKE